MYVVQINEFLILLILIEQIFETKLVSLPGEMNRSADFGRQSELAITKLQSSHGMLIALLERATL